MEYTRPTSQELDMYAELEQVAQYIGTRLLRWRIPVSQYKEKFGQVRVYCQLGHYSLAELVAPHRSWFPPHMRWMFRVRLGWTHPFICPIYGRVYRYYYSRAIRKWPHLRENILSGADFSDLLIGL